MEEKKSVFETLSAINVNDRTEKKNGLTYLSWAWAWGIVKKYYPLATYVVYEDLRGLNYFTDGHTGFVKCGVTIEDIECIEYLPIMDFRNQSIVADKITSFDVNKAIQRCLTKAIARHGLGLYIYAGEDLPESEEESKDVRIVAVENILNGTKYSVDSAQKYSQKTYQKEIANLTEEQFGELLEKLKTL